MFNYLVTFADGSVAKVAPRVRVIGPVLSAWFRNGAVSVVETDTMGTDRVLYFKGSKMYRDILPTYQQLSDFLTDQDSD